MSLEIVLVPLAIAGVGAWKASRATKVDASAESINAVQVNSRMRDGDLVAAALGDLGLRISSGSDGGIAATEEQRHVTFNRDEEGLWHGLFDEAWAEGEAVDLLNRLDVAYGRRVQQEVLAKIRDRAPNAGMAIESETVEEDDSVTVLLTVGANA